MRKLVTIKVKSCFNKAVLLAICSLFAMSCEEGSHKGYTKLKVLEVKNKSGTILRTIELSIPKMHKIEMFRRVYIDDEYSESHSCKIVSYKKGNLSVQFRAGIYNPIFKNPKDNRIKLLNPTSIINKNIDWIKNKTRILGIKKEI